MKASATVRWCSMMLFCLVTVAGYGQFEFSSNVKSAPFPWTHTRFLETNDKFHFAIVSDRASGCRPDVFDDAVAKLNLLRPSFVMSVGDFIEGYTDDVNTLKPQWTKVENIINTLQPPFFYVPGNHDYGAYNESPNARDVREKLWQTLRGSAYYSFVYKNTLFLCLNAMGAENHHWGLGEKQLAWAKEVLAKNPNVRWTFIFLHAPLWEYDGNGSLEKGNENPQRFVELEKSLNGRNYSVFAGHWHQYTYYNRQGMKYYVLATTGGDSDLRGPVCGEFDHIMWVSMTDSGPKFLNLELSGMLPDNVCTETSRNFGKSIQFVPDVSNEKNKKSEFTITFKNTFDSSMKISAIWKNNTLWSIQPKTITGTVQPGEVYSQKFHAEFKGTSWTVMPQLACRFSAGSFNLEQDMTPSLSCMGSIWADLSSITAYRVMSAPVIDGKLNDALWKKTATVEHLMSPDLSGTAEPETRMWIAYDEKKLFLACRCEEEDMKNLVAKVHSRDGDVWNDDCIEFFLDTNLDHTTYCQFDVNSLGAVYDGTGIGQRNFNANVQVATSCDDKGWTVELAIPWKDLNVQPPVTGTKMGYEIARIRPRTDSKQFVSQFPPLGKAMNHQAKLFGLLTFGQ